uniref:Nucleoside diphosphate kinase-like domain-containing protein n=1 Tax=Magallana gigas TaxID=29159 RepID=A0A8W8NQE0_MAGGI
MTGEKATMDAPQIYVERTLAIVKPDAIHKSEEIEDIILRSGFAILQKRRVHLTPEQASDFYAEHYGKMFFPSLVAYMSSGPVWPYVEGDQAISYWRELIGPTNALKARQTHPDCLRAVYGTDDQRNALHGSDSFSSSEKEISSVGQAAKDYLAKSVNPCLLKGLTELCKQKPIDPVRLPGSNHKKNTPHRWLRKKLKAGGNDEMKALGNKKVGR